MSVAQKGDDPGQCSFIQAAHTPGAQGTGGSGEHYYRWRRWPRLDDWPGGSRTPWNRLSPQEEQAVLTAARQSPELSCRQLVEWITDNKSFSVSESRVYRILRKEGLVKSLEMKLKTGKEYHRKTTGPHQMWATDASYFKVISWGYYYLVTVMDDYSRFILATSCSGT